MFGSGNLFSTQPKTVGTGLTSSTISVPTTQSVLSLNPCTASGTMFGSSFTTTVSSSGPSSSLFPGVNTSVVTSLPSTGIFSGLQQKSAALPGFNFGTSATTTIPSTGVTVGFGGTALNISTPATNAVTSIGLGGVDISQTSTGLSNIEEEEEKTPDKNPESVLISEVSIAAETEFNETADFQNRNIVNSKKRKLEDATDAIYQQAIARKKSTLDYDELKETLIKEEHKLKIMQMKEEHELKLLQMKQEHELTMKIKTKIFEILDSNPSSLNFKM